MKKMISSILFLNALLFLLPQVSVQAFELAKKPLVDTVEVYSPSMNVKVKNVVILPTGYDAASAKKYPVVYLLHGHGGKYSTWITKTKPELQQSATQWNMILVCPDAKNSWYWDSPVDPSLKYETYISKELVSYIDKNYKTVASRDGRAVTGYSMGGHGGLWLGINHPDVYAVCGSMSGGVDIKPYPKKWHLEDNLGPYKDNKKVWEAHTVIDVLDKIEPGMIDIIIDCGTEDYFFEINEKIHQAMVYNQIKHDYISRPGAHKHDYWSNAVDYQFLFFSKVFNRTK